MQQCVNVIMQQCDNVIMQQCVNAAMCYQITAIFLHSSTPLENISLICRSYDLFNQKRTIQRSAQIV